MGVSIGRSNWVRRRDLASGNVRDVWYASDYGVAVRTRLGWFAGNGKREIFAELSADPELVEPKVGPCATHAEAILGYDERMKERR
ncbi:hypothetical protein [Sorangium sp. So ce388]|uniref:hypothetical protein n=1 Tax=Sorangium sp. So ce388 TaxID=3133309 RepID=UPI003F5B7B65